jgi:hypothetical protein
MIEEQPIRILCQVLLKSTTAPFCFYPCYPFWGGHVVSLRSPREPDAREHGWYRLQMPLTFLHHICSVTTLPHTTDSYGLSTAKGLVPPIPTQRGNSLMGNNYIRTPHQPNQDVLRTVIQPESCFPQSFLPSVLVQSLVYTGI